MNSIHPTAIVDAAAVLGDENVIGPYAIISRNVRLGDRNWIGAHAILGAPPEVRSVKHTADWYSSGGDGFGVELGNGITVREGVQIHSGLKSATVVGDRCFIMNQSYVAHDVKLGSDVTIASGVRLAGHVNIEAGANLGLSTVVHQFRRVGAFSMLGMASVVSRDVPPFVVGFGNPARIVRVNTVGLERAGFRNDEIEWIHEWHLGAEAAGPPPSQRIADLLPHTDLAGDSL